MGEITVNYHGVVMTATKRISETFTLPDNGIKASELTKLIVSRYPNTGIDRVLEQSRWIVDGSSIDPLGSFVFEEGEDVDIIPRMVGG